MGRSLFKDILLLDTVLEAEPWSFLLNQLSGVLKLDAEKLDVLIMNVPDLLTKLPL